MQISNPVLGDQALLYLKQVVTSCGHVERQELLHYLENVGNFDIVGHSPRHISSQILKYFTPQELCKLRTVSRRWNAKATDNELWQEHSVSYSMLPESHRLEFKMDSDQDAFPVYHDLFRRGMTTARNWETLGSKRYEYHFHLGPVLSLLALDSSRIASGDIDGTIHVWNMRRQTYVDRIQAHKSHVSCLARSADVLASGSSDKSIVIHGLQDLKIQRRLVGHEAPVTSLTFGECGSYEGILFSGSVDRSIRVWNVRTGSCVRVLWGQENTILSLVYISPFQPSFDQTPFERKSVASNHAGWILSGSTDRTMFLWDLQQTIQDKPRVSHSVMEVHGPVTALSLYAEWNNCSMNDQTPPSNPYIRARHPISIPPFIVCAGQMDPTVTLWSIPTLAPTKVESPICHQGTIWAIECAPIHSKIVTVSGDRTVQVWDLKAPKNVMVLEGFDSAVVSCSISNQEDLLCIGMESGAIAVYNLQEFEDSC
ncbi:WD40-repeat-containing domain protein [Phycomyces nitens]|nr:WD40-repeat-containing domain protein [Phycomyces nitens]